MTNTYCLAVAKMEKDNPNVHYHDHDYGFPIVSDDELFGRLILEINQAGLSWNMILMKQKNFKKAYDNYSIKTVAAYNENERERLLQDAGIIRNRLKINAAIHNANVILKLQDEHGSFKQWLDHHHPLSKEEWVKLFKKTFKFTGGEITNEFLMSSGYLKGAHDEECPIFQKIIPYSPKWLINEKRGAQSIIWKTH